MYRKHPALLATVAIFCCLEFLQTGMIAFAASPIMGEIDASPEEYSLIGVFYACVAVVVIAKMRWLVERLGWRTYVIGTVGMYLIGAGVCAASSTVTMFGIGRIIMACGGGGFMTMSRVLVTHIPPGPGRFTGVRVFAMALAVGSAAAPLTASLAINHDHWQGMFWVLGGLALAGGVMASTFLPPDVDPEDVRSRSNPGSLLLLALGSFLFLFALQRSYYDFYSEGVILLAFAMLALVALALYIRGEHNREISLFRLRELRTRRYIAGVALFCFSYMILGADNYVMPYFFQRGLGYSWPTLGGFQSLGLLATLLTWLVMSRILPEFPAPKKFFVLGFAALALCGWWFSSLTTDAPMETDILPGVALHGCFVMLVLATTAMQTFRDVGHDDLLGMHAQQVKNMAAQLATAFGTCFATVFLQWRSTTHYDHLGARVSALDPAYVAAHDAMTGAFSATMESSLAAKAALAQQALQISQQANLLAGIEYFWMIAIIAGVAMVAAMMQKVFR